MNRIRVLLVTAAAVGVVLPALWLRPGAESAWFGRGAVVAPSPSPSPSPEASVEVRYRVVVPVPRVDKPLMAKLFALTNAERKRNGLRPLGWWTQAMPIAQAHTERMVTDARLYHNPKLNSYLVPLGVRVIGENVGVGPTIEQVQRAFMRSRDHRENILSGQYQLMAIWVMRDERNFVWATVNFAG